MEISIRPYGESDLERVIEIWIEGGASTGLPPLPVMNTEKLRASIPEKVVNGSRLIYVACFQNEVVAFIVFWADRLDQLFVHPRFQRNGIGKQLLQFAQSIKPQGYWLYAIAANEGANRFYLREGLHPAGIEIEPELDIELVKYEWKPVGAFKVRH